MVGVEQAGAGRHDAVAVGVGVVADRDVEPVASAKRQAIAYGDDGSIRILPSQSRVMNPNVGSTAVFTTVRSSPYRSAIARQ